MLTGLAVVALIFSAAALLLAGLLTVEAAARKRRLRARRAVYVDVTRWKEKP